MLLRIEQGIGRKDRFAKLPERLLELLVTGIALPGRRRGYFPAGIRCCW
jgi:hypothetical protein